MSRIPGAITDVPGNLLAMTPGAHQGGEHKPNHTAYPRLDGGPGQLEEHSSLVLTEGPPLFNHPPTVHSTPVHRTPGDGLKSTGGPLGVGLSAAPKCRNGPFENGGPKRCRESGAWPASIEAVGYGDNPSVSRAKLAANRPKGDEPPRLLRPRTQPDAPRLPGM